MTEYQVYCLNSKHYRDTFLPHAFNKELSESSSSIDDEYDMYTYNTYNVIMVIQTRRGNDLKTSNGNSIWIYG